MSTKNQNKTNVKQPTRKTSPKKQVNKRNRNNLSSPESTPPPKKAQANMSSDGDPLTIDILRALMGEQTNAIQNCMRDEMKTLSDNIKSEFQTQITQLNDKIDANQANVQAQINELKSDVDQCMKKAANHDDDDLKRIAKLNELKISGISHTNGENLIEIFGAIAKLVKFDLTNAINMPTLTRIYKRDRTTNASTPTKMVIAKFIANHIRNDFFSLYLNKIAAKEPIMTEHINLPGGSRIIIGESLTAINSSIFVEASNQKKQGALCQVFTKDGIVHVKAIKTEKAKPIRSLKQLEMFTLANPQCNNQSAPGGTSSTQTTATTTNGTNMNPSQKHFRWTKPTTVPNKEQNNRMNH